MVIISTMAVHRSINTSPAINAAPVIYETLCFFTPLSLSSQTRMVLPPLYGHCIVLFA